MLRIDLKKIKQNPRDVAPLSKCAIFNFFNTAYETLGCFKDTGNRAIPTLEGKDSILDGAYRARRDAINKCYKAAKKRGYKVFALQHGGWCASSASAEKTFDKYGNSPHCGKDGEGGPWANQVYYIKGKLIIK